MAQFSATSPFAGLAVPEEVKVNRQVLAEPSAELTAPHLGGAWPTARRWSPRRPRGAGRIVLFHVTANADWSNLPLSGLFVDMLRRLVDPVGRVSRRSLDNTVLAPAETLDGLRAAVDAAAGRDRSACQRVRQHRRLAAPSTRDSTDRRTDGAH